MVTEDLFSHMTKGIGKGRYGTEGLDFFGGVQDDTTGYTLVIGSTRGYPLRFSVKCAKLIGRHLFSPYRAGKQAGVTLM